MLDNEAKLVQIRKDANYYSKVSKNILNSYINEHHVKYIFLATDENDVLEYLKHNYTEVEFITSRHLTGDLFWRNPNDVYRNSIEAMIDMLCLSKCNTVLKVSSALSSFSKIINPNLNIYRINAIKMYTDIPYFPDSYIPLLEKNINYTKKCNQILDKIQKDDWSYTHKKYFNNFYYKKR